MTAIFSLIDRGLIPDPLLRAGIRALIQKRLSELELQDEDAETRWAESLRSCPIASHTAEANEQHYEVPAEFFARVLGRRAKYSSALFEDGTRDLDRAEEAMLALTCERAGVRDGEDILELGCGWGSLTLWMAERYRGSRVTAVSNSAGQRRWLENAARSKGLTNVRVVIEDANRFDPGALFDRVVSVEMFEHLRNWPAMLQRMASWLRPQGRAFLHVFSHRSRSYPFEREGDSNWMGRFFFTGGQMPSHDLIARFDEHLQIEESWRVSGVHYARTAEAWLERADRHREDLIRILAGVHGMPLARVWWRRWRVFFMACAELFGWEDGEVWGVSHYRLRRVEDVA